MNSAESTTTPSSTQNPFLDLRFSFHGDGWTFFGILMTNLLLTVVTLGFYFPWARAAIRQYLFQETEFNGSRFTFHGTGREMFRGFLLAILLYGAVFGGYNALNYLQATTDPFGATYALAALGVLFGGNLLLLPLALHGTARYRAARTSWRGIFFHYDGNLGELYKLVLVEGLITLFTFGIYFPWASVKVRKYIFSHFRFGQTIRFEFKGTGSEYFGLLFGGILLTQFTFGLYWFWFRRNLFNYQVENTWIHQEHARARFRSTLKVSDVFATTVINFFQLIFTLGLGAAWVQLRNMSLMFDNIYIRGGLLDTERILQAELDSAASATGDSVGDQLDFDFGFDF